MSAKKQIRLYCRGCCLNFNPAITDCPAEDCALWPFRTGGTILGISKMKAIRTKCIDCLQHPHPKTCKMKSCELYEYREGHRPKAEVEDEIKKPKKVLSPEQLKKMMDGKAKHQNLSPKIKPRATIPIKRRRIHTNP